MSVNPLSSRAWARLVHLGLAGFLGAAVYAPLVWVEAIRPVFQWGVLPLTAASGLWLWLGHRLRRRSAPARSSVTRR